MSTVVVAQRMWQRRDTAANWTAVNPVLSAGEIGFEIDAGQPTEMKVGDGSTPWNTLSKFNYLNVGAQQASNELTALASLAPSTGFLKRTGLAAFTAAALVAGDIPGLDAAKITSGTFVDARIAASSVTQHQAALAISYSQLTGTPPPLLITKVNTVASQAAQLALVAEEGDIAIRTDLNKSYARNTGTSGTMADWSELLTPTDAVLSFNGRIGAVTLTSADVTGALTYTPLNAASYTAADVLAKLLTVDGTGSNLDADLLDGQQGTYYLTASNLTGTLADARLSSNVPLKNTANTWALAQTFTVAPVFTDAATTRTNLGVGLDPLDVTGRLSTAPITDYPLSSIVIGQADNTSGDFGLGTLMTAYVNSSRAFQFYGQALGGAATAPTIKVRSYHNASGGWTNLYTLALREAANTFSAGQVFTSSVQLNNVVGTNPSAAIVNPTIPATATLGYSGFVTSFASVAAAFTTPNIHHFLAQNFTPGVGHTINNHYGFRTGDLTAGGSNYAYHAGVTSTAAGQWNFFAGGAAPNHFNGQVRIGSTVDLGAYALQVTGHSYFAGDTKSVSIGGANQNRSVGYGGQGQFIGERYNGTPGAETALLSGNIIATLSAQGYDGAALSGNRARIRMVTSAAWTTLSHPTYIDFGTTPVGGTGVVDRWQIASDGTFTPVGAMNIGTSVARIGTLYAATGDFSGNVSSGQNFISAGGSVVLATTGAASVLFRPNGVASAVGEVSIDSAGAVAIAGSAAVAGAFSGAAAFRLTGTLSPAQITASQNNYNPSDWTIVSRVRLNLSAAWSLTGWAAPANAWHLLTLHNTSAFALTLAHESASSVAANRFLCPNSANHVVRANGSVTIEYDNVSSRWRVLAS